jgi:hypothetical protein
MDKAIKETTYSGNNNLLSSNYMSEPASGKDMRCT